VSWWSAKYFTSVRLFRFHSHWQSVAADAYEKGIAQLEPRPADLEAHVRACMWVPAE